MSERESFELTRRRIAAIAGGVVGLIGVAVTAALVLDHSFHEHGEPAGHGSGHEEEKDEHGHAKDEHGHGKEEHEEEGHAEEGKIKLTPEQLANAKLELLTASPGKVAVTLSLPGEVALNAEKLAHVSPRVAGAVREVRKQLGDTVKKGDVLAMIDSRELAEMQRELSAARERLSLAESSFQRQEALWKEKISAEKDYLAAKQMLAEAKIDHRSAAQKLAAGAGSGAKGGGYALLAPLDGTIVEKHIAIGEVLREDTQTFTIADLSTLWVQVTVYSRDLPRVAVGQDVLVRAEGVAEPARGRIAYVTSLVGEATRTATARVLLDNPGSAWRPGLFVTADVAIEQVDAPIVISDEGIQTFEGKEVVFVQEGDAFVVHPVELGRRGFAPGDRIGRLVEVLGGLPAGARYVGKNSFLLKAELGKSEAGHEH